MNLIETFGFAVVSPITFNPGESKVTSTASGTQLIIRPYNSQLPALSLVGSSGSIGTTPTIPIGLLSPLSTSALQSIPWSSSFAWAAFQINLATPPGTTFYFNRMFIHLSATGVANFYPLGVTAILAPGDYVLVSGAQAGITYASNVPLWDKFYQNEAPLWTADIPTPPAIVPDVTIPSTHSIFWIRSPSTETPSHALMRTTEPATEIDLSYPTKTLTFPVGYITQQTASLLSQLTIFSVLYASGSVATIRNLTYVNSVSLSCSGHLRSPGAFPSSVAGTVIALNDSSPAGPGYQAEGGLSLSYLSATSLRSQFLTNMPLPICVTAEAKALGQFNRYYLPMLGVQNAGQLKYKTPVIGLPIVPDPIQL